MSWSQDLSNLHLPANLPQQQQQPAQQSIDTEQFDLDAHLSMFANDQFFDYDAGLDPSLAPSHTPASGLDFTDADLQFSGFDMTGMAADQSGFGFAQPTQLPAQQQHGMHMHKTSHPQQQLHPITPVSQSRSRDGTASAGAGATSSTSSSPAVGGQVGKASMASLTQSDTKGLMQEETARLAAEEDKRRRNTAASARFRIKKKQREQATERKANELGTRVDVLEGRIKDLEKENRLLKGLLTERERDRGNSTGTGAGDAKTTAAAKK